MPHIAIRPARAEDQAAVLAFCEPGDYIEYLWDTWLANEQGQIFIATADEQPVGVMNMQMLTESDAWLQGLRVDPLYRRQGIAGALHEAATAEAMRHNATYVRLTVENDNIPSLNLARNMHMRPIGAFRLYTAPPFPAQHRSAPQQGVQIATLDDIDDIIDYLNTSSIFPLVGGLYYAQYMARPIEVPLLEQKVLSQQVYFLRRWERIEGLAIAEMRQQRAQQLLSVGYIDGTAIEAISLIAYDLRTRLLEMELDQVQIYAPDMVLVQDAFDGVEYEPDTALYQTFERGLF